MREIRIIKPGNNHDNTSKSVSNIKLILLSVQSFRTRNKYRKWGYNLQGKFVSWKAIKATNKDKVPTLNIVYGTLPSLRPNLYV